MGKFLQFAALSLKFRCPSQFLFSTSSTLYLPTKFCFFLGVFLAATPPPLSPPPRFIPHLAIPFPPYLCFTAFAQVCPRSSASRTQTPAPPQDAAVSGRLAPTTWAVDPVQAALRPHPLDDTSLLPHPGRAVAPANAPAPAAVTLVIREPAQRRSRRTRPIPYRKPSILSRCGMVDSGGALCFIFRKTPFCPPIFPVLGDGLFVKEPWRFLVLRRNDRQVHHAQSLASCFAAVMFSFFSNHFEVTSRRLGSVLTKRLLPSLDRP